jgi:peptide/nickel transport system substrate-binding protein
MKAMPLLASPPRRAFIAGALAAGTLTAPLPFRRARAQSASVLNIATVGEPNTLDPMWDTSGLLSELLEPMFELLYIFTPSLSFAPVLASALPDISPDGLRYTIPLRTDVKFHDLTPMTAEDVVASVKRWMAVSPRGRLVANTITEVNAKDANTVELRLRQSYAPLLALLAFPNSAMVVMPKRFEAQTQKPLTEFIGTGPWKFLEHVPDRYVRVTKFDGYTSPPGKPDGYAGERHALIDELRFIPVPNINTRADGLISGEYDFADQLTAEAYAKLKANGSVATGLMTIPTWPIIIFNTKQGPMANVKARLAAQAAIVPEDMMAATFSDRSLWKLEGSIFPKGTEWYIEAPDGYNQHNTEKARSLLRESGYKGETVRLLAAPQYDYMIKVGQVAAQNLADAGFNIDLRVLDWATVLQVRTHPAEYEGFVTGEGGETDPSQVNVFNKDYPGWWDSEAKRAVTDQFVSEPDHQKRLAIWQKLHGLFYSEAPSLKVGEFYSPFGIAKNLTGYAPMPWPAFWNVQRTS